MVAVKDRAPLEGVSVGKLTSGLQSFIFNSSERFRDEMLQIRGKVLHEVGERSVHY